MYIICRNNYGFIDRPYCGQWYKQRNIITKQQYECIYEAVKEIENIGKSEFNNAHEMQKFFIRDKKTYEVKYKVDKNMTIGEGL